MHQFTIVIDDVIGGWMISGDDQDVVERIVKSYIYTQLRVHVKDTEHTEAVEPWELARMKAVLI